MTGENAIFSEEAYLYALSKGVLLYGLDHQEHSVHGGIAKRSGEVIAHDQAHHHQLLAPASEEEVSEEIYAMMAGIIKDMAGRFYNLIKHGNIFEEEKKARAPILARGRGG